MEKDILNAQSQHWKNTYSKNKEMFGRNASEPAQYAAALFHERKMHGLLELGAGQGRDTLFFANHGFRVYALDYADTGVDELQRLAEVSGISQSMIAVKHDIRQPLPFPDGSFDACYAHMLFCMALTTVELHHLSNEIHRILKPNGICVYTVRHKGDAHYKVGTHRGEDMYEMGGFIVHFFNKEKVYELASGFDILNVAEFEEGVLPRKLFRVTLEKQG